MRFDDRIHDVRPGVADWKSVVGRKQLHVLMGISDFLQYALGMDTSVRHLRQLEYLDCCLQRSEQAAGSEEDQIDRANVVPSWQGKSWRLTAAPENV